MTDWNIQVRSRSCQACGKAFLDKEGYHTLLLDEREDFHRTDICQACWQKQSSEGGRDRKGFVSYWQGVYETPPPPSDPIQKETAESLLRKLIELNDPKYIPAGYILAVMLERKQLLKVKEQVVRDGQRVFIYEQPKTGDVFTIVDPKLQLNQLEAVQQDVGALLEHGLRTAQDTQATSKPPYTSQAKAVAPPTPEVPPARRDWRQFSLGLGCGLVLGLLGFFLLGRTLGPLPQQRGRYILTDMGRSRALKMDTLTGQTWIVNSADGTEVPIKPGP